MRKMPPRPDDSAGSGSEWRSSWPAGAALRGQMRTSRPPLPGGSANSPPPNGGSFSGAPHTPPGGPPRPPSSRHGGWPSFPAPTTCAPCPGRGSAHGASGAQCRFPPGTCLWKDGPDLLWKSLKAIHHHGQDSVSRNRRQSLSRSPTRRGERIEDADRVKDLPVLQVLGQQDSAGTCLGGGDDERIPPRDPKAFLNHPGSLQDGDVRLNRSPNC